MTEVSVIAGMRDWLLDVCLQSNFDDMCGYTAPEVLSAIEEMYPNGVIGWFVNVNSN